MFRGKQQTRRPMKIDHSSHLNLVFPQWQGSGPSNTLYHAANRLADICTDIGFIPIRVPEKQRLHIAHDILGYESILSLLRRANTIIEQANPESIMVVGGDCGVELAPVSFLNQRHGGNLALVWLDAHGDLNTPQSSPSKHFHGMPLRTLCGGGDQRIMDQCFSLLSPDQVILAGARDLDPAEEQFIRDHGVSQVSVQAMAADPKSIVREIHKKGFRHVYVHIDMDVLDPEGYPWVKHPTPQGLTIKNLGEILSAIAVSFHVAGLGLVEFTAKELNPSEKPAPRFVRLTRAEIHPGLAGIRTLMDIFR